MTPVKELKGIGGWLILVAINLVLAPIRVMFDSVKTYYEIFNIFTFSDMVEQLGMTFIYLFWAEFAFNIALIAMYVLAAYWFFTTNYRFPKFYIVLLIFNAVILIVDVVVSYQWFNVSFDPSKNSDDAEMIRVIVYACIWIPYILRSERVRNTFVRQPLANQPQSSIVM